MPEIDLTTLDLQPYLDAAPLAWSVGLGASAVVGLILWLAGGKLAKAGVVLGGFVLGGLVATSLAVAWTPEGSGGAGGGPWMIGLGIGGAIAGALLATLLYRLWIALAAAVVLAAVVPAATLIWTGQTPQADQEQIEAAVEDVKTAAAQAVQETLADPDVAANLTGDLATDLVSEEFKAAATQKAQQLLDVLREAWANQLAALRVWWDELEPGTRQAVMGGSIVGALVGLLLGLVLPKVAASLQTALVGSMLMFFPGGVLLRRYVGGDGWLPQSPQSVLLTLGLITLLGLLLQCTVFRKKTDK